jgi:ATP-binding cassette subfamily B protein
VGQGRTRITITHRLSSVSNADTIFVLDRGELVEQGDHAELLAAGGLYRQLFDEQSGRATSAPQHQLATLPELRAFPFLRPLDDGQLQSMLNRLVPVSLPGGSTVIRQGESGDSLYLIRQGEVEVCRFDGVLEHRVAVLGDGEYFGEISLLTEQPRSATIRTRTACDFLALSRDAFNDLLSTVPAWADAVRQVADRRVSLAHHE